MKKAIAITFAVIGGILVLLVGIGLVVGPQPAPAPAARKTTAPAVRRTPAVRNTTTNSPAHTATPAAGRTTPAAPATTAPATPAPVHVTRKVIRVLFKVTGTGTPSITYGSDSDSRSPGGTLGPLSDGNALPWHAWLRYDKNALYYDVSAQLEGSGDIACTLSIQVTQYYSDGTHISRSKVAARGHASGGYNICDAQANN